MLERVRAWLGRQVVRAGAIVAPQRTRTRILALATYEAASQTRRARGWHAPTVGPNTGVVYSLRTLRDRSRAAVRNDGYAGSAIDEIVSNMVGTGILPQSKAPDEDFRKRLHRLWFDWTDQADADGLCDFYGMQALAVRGWMEAGEIFLRLRPRLAQDGLAVPLQVQLLEAELVPHEYTTVYGANKIRAGIEFSPIGQRAAYWAWQQRPEQLDPFLEGGAMVRLPADQVIHLYAPVRAGQIRGLPQLTQALVKLHDLDKFDDATLLRQQLSNMFVGFLTRTGLTEQPDVDPLTGRTAATENDQALVGMEPGLWQELAPGEDVKFSDPPEATGYADFMRAQLRGAAVAAGVPYEVLTGDLREINDRTVRVILQGFRRRIEQRQHQVVAFVMNRRIWTAFVTRAIVAGALEVPAAYWDDPTPWLRAEWIPPAWPYLHPVQDVEYENRMVRSGFKSRAQVAKERGWDVEALDEEIAADRRRAEALGLQFDSDGWRAVNAKGEAPPEPAGIAGNAAPSIIIPPPAVTVQVSTPGGGFKRIVTERDDQGRIREIVEEPVGADAR